MRHAITAVSHAIMGPHSRTRASRRDEIELAAPTSLPMLSPPSAGPSLLTAAI
ncbi:hypothetical protein C8Q76DRAFT_750363 [Earliella scabrosa]|nr:hypothetical protein C8Q76DRAFT_750363 [Earliella scabrosa]